MDRAAYRKQQFHDYLAGKHGPVHVRPLRGGESGNWSCAGCEAALPKWLVGTIRNDEQEDGMYVCDACTPDDLKTLALLKQL